MTNPRHGPRAVIGAILGVLLGGCASSPSVFAAHGSDAAQTARLTWLMFGIAAIVLIIITILILLVFLRPQDSEARTDVYANDRRALNGVLVGGGLVPIAVLMVVMGIGIGLENRSSNPPASDSLSIEVIGQQWGGEVH